MKSTTARNHFKKTNTGKETQTGTDPYQSNLHPAYAGDVNICKRNKVMKIKKAHASPRNIAERITEKNGSIALIVWVNETATFPRLIFVKRLPNVCTTARGTIAASCQGNIAQSKYHFKNYNQKWRKEDHPPKRRHSKQYLWTANFWSFVEIKNPHKRNQYSPYSKLNSRYSYRVVENLQNLWTISAAWLVTLHSI